MSDQARTESDYADLRDEAQALASQGFDQAFIRRQLDVESPEEWDRLWKDHDDEHESYQQRLAQQHSGAAEAAERADRVREKREAKKLLEEQTHLVLAEWDRDRQRAAEAEARKRLGLG